MVVETGTGVVETGIMATGVEETSEGVAVIKNCYELYTYKLVESCTLVTC